MTFEVEMKFPLNDIESIEYFLLEQNAELLGISNQRDHYYNHPCRDFQTTDEALRIREDGKDIYLTYKGTKIDTESKTRKEFEIEILDFLKMESILQSLGFCKVLIIAKERKNYQLENITINLDYIEFLGYFIELEIIVEEQKQIDKAKKQIFDLIKRMGIKIESQIRESYLELILQKKNNKES